jgi:MFS family permease
MPAAHPAAPPRLPHPVVWFILILPFGALGGFVTVGLTFLATQHGLSVTEGAFLGAAQLVTQWLKWIWAPIVDITLTPARWYVLATLLSAGGVLAMSAIPLSPQTLGPLLLVIGVAGLINSMVGMAVEAMIAGATPRDQVGRVSGWMQAGNLGGNGFGGGLGLYLLEHLPAPWMAGAVVGGLMAACCLALRFTPRIDHRHDRTARVGPAMRWLFKDVWATFRTQGGMLAALLFVLPVGTGAAAGVLTQAEVARHWAAGATEVALLQGVLSGVITAAGCFAGGWMCERWPPRTAYAAVGIVLAAIASGMALAPAGVPTYVVGSMVYNFAVGIAYAAFTAVVLEAIGAGSGATKYSVLASLSNFPIWWMGLLLGWVADHQGPAAMLHTEAALGVLGVAVFALAALRIGRLVPAG